MAPIANITPTATPTMAPVGRLLSDLSAETVGVGLVGSCELVIDGKGVDDKEAVVVDCSVMICTTATTMAHQL